MMISWVALVNPSHLYLENDQLRRLTLTICAFHLGFGLVGLHWLLSETDGSPGLYLYVVLALGAALFAIVAPPATWDEIRARQRRRRE